MQQLSLTHGWQVKQHAVGSDLQDDLSADGWIAAQVPGTIHTDLLAAERIPDPFYGLNECDVQWVGEADWLYRCTFDLPAELLDAPFVDLVCDGLDTFATVLLNDQQIMSSDNMFVAHRVPIREKFRSGQNTIAIVFESAWRRGREIERALRPGSAIDYPAGVRHVWNGDPSRVFVRKAQYHYGWDWGPKLITAGIWRPIRIESYAARIADMHCPVEVGDDLRRATLPVEIAVAGDANAVHVDMQLVDPDGGVVDRVSVAVADGVACHTFAVADPRLWWPQGYGDQPLYRIEARLRSADNQPLDERTLRIGLRRLRLVQEPVAGEPGSSFVFEINNTPIFCGGANWIPADSFTPRITDETYRRWLQSAVNSNMVMLRVWGGGIYEADVFYDLCDELGLLVWQDWMFACGMYPAHEEFQRSVRAEVEHQLRRLRHHPSIVLWCGNNEDYQLAQSLHAYDRSVSIDDAAGVFPARQLYERLLPDICAALDPLRPYWPGSPYGGDDVFDPTIGDRHSWEVWHGPIAPYHDYPLYRARFVSEFGLEAAPAMETIRAFAPPEEQYAQSRTLDWHNKSTDGPRRLAVYLNDTLRVEDNIESYVYATQFVQAEALKAAYSGWRRRWGTDGRRSTAGALVWQLNDCWPVTSWAIVDYALRPKPAWFAVKRELAPLVIGVVRTDQGADVWAVNSTQNAITAELYLATWTLDGDKIGEARRAVTIAPNAAAELGAVDLALDDDVVLCARLLRPTDVLARAALWPEPFKYLALPDPQISVSRSDSDEVTVQTRRPAKGVWLDAGDGVAWADNMLDLFPDEERRIVVAGLSEREVRVRYLGAKQA